MNVQGMEVLQPEFLLRNGRVKVERIGMRISVDCELRLLHLLGPCPRTGVPDLQHAL